MAPTIDIDRHLLGLEGMTRERLETLLDRAEGYRAIACGESPPMGEAAGWTVANLFFEDSTRTRISFTLAAQRLGATTVDLAEVGSSVAKGETLLDTARTVEAMGVRALVIRSPHSGTSRRIAEHVRSAVINAGDGRHEHPTQGLLDVLTLRNRWGTLEGRRLGIVGDVANSRVARSNIHGMTTMGVDVVLIGPPPLVPAGLAEMAVGPGCVSISHDFDAAIAGLDAVMMLRVQRERQEGGTLADDYRLRYGLTVARAERLGRDAAILHPGPLNRGLEIDDEVADDPERSVILDQVANGVAVRMAVLAILGSPDA